MKTLTLMFAAVALSGIAIPMPEDLALLAAGASVDRLHMLPVFALVGVAAVLTRDGLFYGLGRLLGEGALRWSLFRRMIGEERIERARAMVDERGGRAVLAARFMVGFRTPAFFMAGVMGVRLRDFLFWDTVGALVGVPVVLGLGMFLGDPITTAIQWVLEHKLLVVALLGILGAAWYTSEQARKMELTGARVG